MAPWLPDAFDPPAFVALATGHHLRPIRASDLDIDYPAVMGSQARLWAEFGDAWGWPPDDLTREEDLRDLERHEREMVARTSYNYAILPAAESELLGCVYVDPPTTDGADAEFAWWVVDRERGGPLEEELRTFVPDWVATAWPFRAPRFLGGAPR
jgi:hypothetical protein